MTYLLFLVLSLCFSSSSTSPLSNEAHMKGGTHNTEYDHEAFLGRDLKKTFDELTPDESLLYLGKIVDKIDKDGDTMVTQDELRKWVNFRNKHYIDEDVEVIWNATKRFEYINWDIRDVVRQNLTVEEDEPITWDLYLNNTYRNRTPEDEKQIRRDQVRWQAADRDDDEMLSKEEYKAFLHPQEFEHTKMVYVREQMEDMDEDKDGYVSFDEYMDSELASRESDPEDVEYERKQFEKDRDKNKDGKLDLHELWEVLLGPIGYDPALSEAMHLIKFADSNKDGILSRQEILDNHDLFVGSSATSFGDDLPRHDEF